MSQSARTQDSTAASATDPGSYRRVHSTAGRNQRKPTSRSFSEVDRPGHKHTEVDPDRSPPPAQIRNFRKSICQSKTYQQPQAMRTPRATAGPPGCPLCCHAQTQSAGVRAGDTPQSSPFTYLEPHPLCRYQGESGTLSPKVTKLRICDWTDEGEQG